MARLAVVLFNLGGPDDREAIEPFLRNLFRDPMIIRLPAPLRWPLAWMIARRRIGAARAIYDQIGGTSPLLANTEAQAQALESELAKDCADGDEAKVFVAMRHWHPFAAETAGEVKAWGPDRVIGLPLYPQFSTTTSASSLADWRRAAVRAGLRAKTSAVCCYPIAPDFIRAHATLIEQALDTSASLGVAEKARILFSAHGLPERVIKNGDPYCWQIEQTAKAVIEALGRRTRDERVKDWVVCYQSRVGPQTGPLSWTKPATEAEIVRSGQTRTPVIVVPISFVSEHSETLVELGIDYRRLALLSGVPFYLRVQALGTEPLFIRALAGLVRAAAKGEGVSTADGARLCPLERHACPVAGHGSGPDR
jgi:ferrochelatase